MGDIFVILHIHEVHNITVSEHNKHKMQHPLFLTNLKKEALTFCETTSIKGAPRIVKSTELSFKLLWAIIVTCLLSLACFQTYSLLVHYFKYPVQTMVVDYDLANYDQAIHAYHKYGLQFPDITLCNLNNMASNGHHYLPNNISSQQEYYELIETSFRKTINDTVNLQQFGINIETLKRIWRKLYYHGYRHFISSSYWDILAHDESVFINSCYVLTVTSSGTQEHPCTDMATITEVWTNEYFKCFTISPHNHISVYGISAILYLDDFLETIPLYFDPFEDVHQESGVRISIQPKGYFPDIKNTGKNVMPGRHTRYNLKYTGISNLPVPYSECNDGDEVYLTDDMNRTIPYTLGHCYAGCYQKRIIEQCDCISSISNIILHDSPGNYDTMKHCEKIFTDNLPYTVSKMKCAEDAKSNIEPDYCNICRSKCTHLLFETTESQSKWPSSNTFLSFYRSRIKNQTYNYRFSNYENIINEWLNNTISKEEASIRSRTSTLIEDNFIKITVTATSLHFLTYEGVPAFTTTFLLSSLGGTLNLYAGITIIFLVEILEFILRLLLKFILDDKKQDSKVNNISSS